MDVVLSTGGTMSMTIMISVFMDAIRCRIPINQHCVRDVGVHRPCCASIPCSEHHWQPQPCQCPSGSNLNLTCLISHRGAQLVYGQSVLFDSLCSIRMVLTAGLHGASHCSLRASLRGQSASTLNSSCDSPHIGTIHVHAFIHANRR